MEFTRRKKKNSDDSSQKSLSIILINHELHLIVNEALHSYLQENLFAMRGSTVSKLLQFTDGRANSRQGKGKREASPVECMNKQK